MAAPCSPHVWRGQPQVRHTIVAALNLLLTLSFHHAFPKDFRNGPHPASAHFQVRIGPQLTDRDWDPTKWIIHMLHTYTPFVPSIARTPESAIRKARARVYLAHAERLTSSLAVGETIRPLAELPVWSRREVKRRNGEWVTGQDGTLRRRVLLLLEGCVVDAGGFLEDHVCPLFRRGAGYTSCGCKLISSPEAKSSFCPMRCLPSQQGSHVRGEGRVPSQN